MYIKNTVYKSSKGDKFLLVSFVFGVVAFIVIRHYLGLWWLYTLGITVLVTLLFSAIYGLFFVYPEYISQTGDRDILKVVNNVQDLGELKTPKGNPYMLTSANTLVALGIDYGLKSKQSNRENKRYFEGFFKYVLKNNMSFKIYNLPKPIEFNIEIKDAKPLSQFQRKKFKGVLDYMKRNTKQFSTVIIISTGSDLNRVDLLWEQLEALEGEIKSSFSVRYLDRLSFDRFMKEYSLVSVYDPTPNSTSIPTVTPLYIDGNMCDSRFKEVQLPSNNYGGGLY